MELTRHDVSGLVLVTATVGLLVLHGPSRHDAARTSGVAPVDTVSLDGLPTPERGKKTPVAFVGVNVVAGEGGVPRRNQVVVVVDGRIARMGPVGTIEAPPGSVVVQGSGSDFLVPATRLVTGEGAGIDPSLRLVPGSETDLALLREDPRLPTTSSSRPEGLLLSGAWFPLVARESHSAASRSPVGGH